MAANRDRPVIILRPVKRVAAGHHGGAWKVAYADFITTLFALFLVLWLLSQADLKLRQEIARYFRNAGVQSGGSMLGDKFQLARTNDTRPLEASLTIVQGAGEELAALRGQAKEIQEALERGPEFAGIKDHVRIEVTAEGLEIQVVDSGASGKKGLLFDLSSAELKPELVALLKELAGHLKTLPNHIEIGGHTDARPFAAGAGLLSTSSRHAARRIVEACRYGESRLVLTPQARLLQAADVLLPGLTAAGMILAARLLPAPTGPSGDAVRNRPPSVVSEIRSRPSANVVSPLWRSDRPASGVTAYGRVPQYQSS